MLFEWIEETSIVDVMVYVSHKVFYFEMQGIL